MPQHLVIVRSELKGEKAERQSFSWWKSYFGIQHLKHHVGNYFPELK